STTITRIADQSKRAGIKGGRRVRQVGAVEHIKHFHSELRLQTLQNLEVFEERRIDGREARPIDGVSAQVARGACGGSAERIAIHPTHALRIRRGWYIGERIANQIDAIK